MNELKVALSNALGDQRAQGAWLKSLQIGQTLQARVLDVTNAGRLILGVGGRQIVADSQFPVARGSALTLQVNSMQPLPRLQILEGPQHSPVPVDPVQRQLQQLFPRQGSVAAPLMSLVDSGKKVNILSVLGLKSDALERIEKQVQQAGLLTTFSGLQKAVSESGLFFESQLLQQMTSKMPPAEGDFKALLLRLLERSRQLTNPGTRPPLEIPDSEQLKQLPGFSRQLEAALAAITVNQIAAVDSARAGGAYWLLDLPFALRNALSEVRLSFQRHRVQGDDAEDRDVLWRAIIRVNLPHLGPLEGELFLQAQRLSLLLYAQLPIAMRILEGNSNRLRSLLEAQGFTVSVLRVTQGVRPDRGSAEGGVRLGVSVST